MQLEDVQKVLHELSTFTQFVIAIIGVYVILSPVFQHLDYNTPSLNFIVRFLTFIFQFIGLPDLTQYTRPKEYYEKLAKQLNESELATTRHAARICIASHIPSDDPSALVSGLVNTGNSCFINSVLQAFSSLTYLHDYLQTINTSTPPGLPLPVSRSLLKTLRRLSQPMYRRTSFRPTEVVTALSSNRRITNREQQDAQEFFQLISGALDTEAQRVVQYTRFGGGFKELLSVDNQGQRDNSHTWLGRGLKGLVNPVIKRKEFENPLTGLLANRLSCLKCKYTGAIRHFSFNNIQLNLPNKYTATLEECLSRFTDIEYLQDASCRRCSFIATIETLEQEIARLKKKSKKTNQKKQLAPLQAKKSRMEHLLKMRRIDDDDEEGSKEECVRMSCLSSKQVMLAKPPKILCLHVSRSAYLSTGMVYKNQCRLLFPEYLDIGLYTTDGADINVERPQESMSNPSDQNHDRRIYKLMSVVVHYGSHSYGHFVAYKRRIYTDRCECDQCGAEHKKEIYNGQDVWYRISDTKVDECTLEDVLHSNPYMLLYELDESMSSRDYCASVSSRSSIGSDSSTHVPLFEEKSNDIYSPIDDAAKEALFVANALLRSAA